MGSGLEELCEVPRGAGLGKALVVVRVMGSEDAVYSESEESSSSTTSMARLAVRGRPFARARGGRDDETVF